MPGHGSKRQYYTYGQRNHAYREWNSSSGSKTYRHECQDMGANVSIILTLNATMLIGNGSALVLVASSGQARSSPRR
jgi:hypothetical protein